MSKADRRAAEEAAAATRSKLLTGVIITCVIAMPIAGYLTKVYYDVHGAGTAAGSICDLSAKVSCSSVAASSYAQFWGLPLSTYGLVTYAVLGLWAYLGLTPKGQLTRHTPVYVFLIGLWSVILSVYLVYIMLAKIDTFCVFCGALYVCNIALFVLGVMLIRNEKFAVVGTVSEDVSYALKHPKAAAPLAALFLIGGGAIAVNATDSRSSSAATVDFGDCEFMPGPEDKVVTQSTGKKAVTFDTSRHPRKGNPDAQLHIVEFADYRCPACKAAHEEIKKIEKEHPDEISVTFANFPLDIECNSLLRRQVHHRACEAAFAAICAGEQGKYWEYNDVLFTNQKKWASDEFRGYARDMGLNMDRFEQCMVSPATKEFVQRDIQKGVEMGVQSTPTLFIEGCKFPGALSLDMYDQVKQEIAAKKSVSAENN